MWQFRHVEQVQNFFQVQDQFQDRHRVLVNRDRPKLALQTLSIFFGSTKILKPWTRPFRSLCKTPGCTLIIENVVVLELHEANESALDGLIEMLLDLPLDGRPVDTVAALLLVPKDAVILCPLCPFDFETIGYAFDDFVV